MAEQLFSNTQQFIDTFSQHYPQVQLFIFDCDGTLLDTLPAHYAAWRACYEQSAEDFLSHEDFSDRLNGVVSTDIARVLNDLYEKKLQPQQAAIEKEAIFHRHHLTDVRPIDAVVDIARAYQQRLPMAVASNGHKKTVISQLTATGIIGLFETVVTIEDVAHGKPSPDMFLEAARRLQVAPENCFVFEDSPAGLTAAKSAGMAALDVHHLTGE